MRIASYVVTGQGSLPNFAIPARLTSMSTMNISLPDVLKEFVTQQASTAGYGISGEYVRELIRRDQERTQLRTSAGRRAVQTIGPGRCRLLCLVALRHQETLGQN